MKQQVNHILAILFVGLANIIDEYLEYKVMKLKFTTRDNLSAFGWDTKTQKRERPNLNRKNLIQLLKYTKLSGFLRISSYAMLLIAPVWSTIYLGRDSIWLAIPIPVFPQFPLSQGTDEHLLHKNIGRNDFR